MIMIRYTKMVYCFLIVGMLWPLAAQDSLKIVTYNLEGMKPGSDPQTRIQYIIQHLKTINPDIIGVQEINESPATGSDNQAKIIVDSLSAYFGVPYFKYIGFTHVSWDNQFNEYVGIISKLPVQQSGYDQLVTGTFPRKVLWSQIITSFGTLNFFNTHLDHLSSDIRILQVKGIISYISQMESIYPPIASILTGDFNDIPSTPTIQLLTNPGTVVKFIDSYQFANPFSLGYTVPADAPSRKIDYIFYKSTGQLEIKISKIVMNEPYSGYNYPSDHLGVMTIFTKNTTARTQDTDVKAPAQFELSQNYPNPFNPATIIQFILPHRSFVTLKVYDLLGREIASLLSEEKREGRHQVSFDASSVAGGLYIYKITAESYTDSKRMLLIK